jgi:VanZ family protein
LAPTRREYAWLALAFLLVALYGSLVPFEVVVIPWHEAARQFRDVLSAPLTFALHSDWAANVLLFIPLGFLLMAAACADRPKGVSCRVALAVVPGCTLLSAAIEFIQLYLPDRVSSLNDIVAESLGGLIGTVAWLGLGQWWTERLRSLWTTISLHGRAARLLPGYLALLALVHLMPIDLSLSPWEIWRKYDEGMISLYPFAGERPERGELIRISFWSLVYYLPLGLLLTQLPIRAWRPVLVWLWILVVGWVTAGTMELLQLFVVPRSAEVLEVLAGGPAVLAGWSLGVARELLCKRSSRELGHRL